MQYWNPYILNTGMNNNLFRDNIVRVNGVAGANAYQMGANERAVLFDENNDYFFMKTTDGAGYPTLRTFKFEEVKENTGSGFVTIEEYNRGINELKEMINNGFESVRKQSAESVNAEG